MQISTLNGYIHKCFAITVSLSGGKTAAPAQHGPLLDKQDPSVNAKPVPLGVSLSSVSTICLPNCSWSLNRDFDEPRVLQYAGVATVTMK